MKKFVCFVLCALLCFSFASCGEKTPPVSGSDDSEQTTEATLEPVTLNTSGAASVPAGAETRVRMAAAGDNIPHDSVVATASTLASGAQKYNFSEIFSGIRELISSADIAFVNQESPVGGTELGISGYPNFNAPKEMVEALIDTGFDVFNIANNHMLDKGASGYINTIEYFNSLPVTMIGGYTKKDYDTVRIVEHSGVKIAFLSYTTLVNYAHAGDLPASSEYLIPYADTKDITRQVGLAKQQADVVIVSFHWGTEDEFGVTAEQSKYASLCADLGVDVVLGHHPHVVGGVEYLTGESGNQTLVAYSLGNLCSTMLYGKNMVGEILTFDIVRDADGAIHIENALVNPVISHYKTDTSKKDSQGLSVRYDVRLYLMEDYTEALAKEHGANNWGSFTFETLKKYITDYTDAAFLPEFLK